MTAPPRPRRVRDAIVGTACEMFYAHGIRGVGVDTIAAEAGTNKMSFYRNFESKNELVAEYLEQQEREYFAWWDATVAPHQGDARRQVEALFTAFTAFAREKCARGCALANAAVEIEESDPELAGIVRRYKSEIRRRLTRFAEQMGASDPGGLGDALMLLMEGSHYTRLTFAPGRGPESALLAAARALMDAHAPV